MSETTCEEFHELSAELALGVADARGRAAALVHLEHCAACRFDLRQLSDLADALGALTPAVEPPAGFESRVLERLERTESSEAAPTHRVPHRAWWAAAAAVVAVVAGAAGWTIGDQAGRPPAAASGQVVTAKLTADHEKVGQVVIETRSAPWISMAMEIGSGDRSVQCRLVAADGRVLSVGWFTLSDGYGYWAAPIDAPTGTSVDAAQVTDADGRVLASATLPAVRIATATSS
ncbi:MAG TPA: hypothetical protein VEJ44_06900 [Acidimicrobiales bacterium]|nr:hypothetical protein [Acidimicrobiales bacterium]